MIFESYLRPYYEAIFNVLPYHLDIDNATLSDKIKQTFNCKTDILFLTQSNGRYISSWLNIARDDFGILDFAPRKKSRQILLNPITANKESFISHIDKHSKYNDFKEIFERILREI